MLGGILIMLCHQKYLISKKLKTFAHNEFSSEEFSSVETIRKNFQRLMLES